MTMPTILGVHVKKGTAQDTCEAIPKVGVTVRVVVTLGNQDRGSCHCAHGPYYGWCGFSARIGNLSFSRGHRAATWKSWSEQRWAPHRSPSGRRQNPHQAPRSTFKTGPILLVGCGYPNNSTPRKLSCDPSQIQRYLAAALKLSKLRLPP